MTQGNNRWFYVPQPIKSLDPSGGSVFRNLLRAAEGFF